MCFDNRSTGIRRAEQRVFDTLLGSTALVLLFDTGMWVFDGGTAQAQRVMNLIATTGYYIMTPVIYCAWLIYYDFRLNNHEKQAGSRGLCRYLIPLAVFVIVSATSQLTKWVFYIDSDNVYHRGSFFWVYALLSFTFIAGAVAMPLIKAARERSEHRRKEYIGLAMFTAPVFVGAIVQGAFYGVSVIWVATVISILMAYMNIQNRQIAVDALTGLNNRRRFDTYLDRRTDEFSPMQKLYMLYVDIDSFKEINDTLGHSAGDAALMDAADILKKAADKNDFIARIGGDEFAVISVREPDGDVNGLLSRIVGGLREFNSGNERFTLSFSIGQAEYGSDGVKTPGELIKAADESMYRVKNAKK